MTSFEHFKKLHEQSDPLILANVWNAQSARVFEKLNFKAVGTTSAGVAETLGYADGEEMTFDEYFFVIRRLKASTNLPLSVDLEAGYGDTAEEVAANIVRLSKIGVVGVNIEDSTVSAGLRTIADGSSFAKKLTQVTSLLASENSKVFINVRCDAFLLSLPDARNEAIRRMGLYENTGIDGVFLPCITHLDDVVATVSATRQPLNVMCMPGLPDFDKLKKAGVRRISMGNFVNKATYASLESTAERIVKEGSFLSLFAK